MTGEKTLPASGLSSAVVVIEGKGFSARLGPLGSRLVLNVPLLSLPASSVVSSHGPTSATREQEKRILESILPPDLRHLVRGGSPATIQVRPSLLWP